MAGYNGGIAAWARAPAFPPVGRHCHPRQDCYLVVAGAARRYQATSHEPGHLTGHPPLSPPPARAYLVLAPPSSAQPHSRTAQWWCRPLSLGSYPRFGCHRVGGLLAPQQLGSEEVAGPANKARTRQGRAKVKGQRSGDFGIDHIPSPPAERQPGPISRINRWFYSGSRASAGLPR